MSDLQQKVAAVLAAAQPPDAPLHMAVQALAWAGLADVLRRALAQHDRRIES